MAPVEPDLPSDKPLAAARARLDEAARPPRPPKVVVEKPPKPILQLKPETHHALADVVETCLAKDPAERFESAGAFAAALAGSL